jgi:hypothetical protein
MVKFAAFGAVDRHRPGQAIIGQLTELFGSGLVLYKFRFFAV